MIRFIGDILRGMGNVVGNEIGSEIGRSFGIWQRIALRPVSFLG